MTYAEERAALREIFPRGRFQKDEDGTCILKARQKVFAWDHVFVQAEGRLLGIFYVGKPNRYRNRLGELIADELRGDGEGILHVRWSPEVGQKLPMFSRKPAAVGRSAAELASIRPSKQASAAPRLDAETST